MLSNVTCRAQCRKRNCYKILPTAHPREYNFYLIQVILKIVVISNFWGRLLRLLRAYKVMKRKWYMMTCKILIKLVDNYLPRTWLYPHFRAFPLFRFFFQWMKYHDVNKILMMISYLFYCPYSRPAWKGAQKFYHPQTNGYVPQRISSSDGGGSPSIDRRLPTPRTDA